MFGFPSALTGTSSLPVGCPDGLLPEQELIANKMAQRYVIHLVISVM